MSDLDRQIETLRRCELITEEEVKQLCSKAREILVEESNTQRVDSPVTVCGLLIPFVYGRVRVFMVTFIAQICGDIHGQFYDIKELFKVWLLRRLPQVMGHCVGSFICFIHETHSPHIHVLFAEGWRLSRDKLFIHGRLCGPRLLFRRDIPVIVGLEGTSMRCCTTAPGIAYFAHSRWPVNTTLILAVYRFAIRTE